MRGSEAMMRACVCALYLTPPHSRMNKQNHIDESHLMMFHFGTISRLVLLSALLLSN